MERVKREDWGDICVCEHIGVEFNKKRDVEGYEGTNIKASVVKVTKDMFVFHDLIEDKGTFEVFKSKKIFKSIPEALNSPAAGIKVYSFKDSVELNTWILK